jgi:hypothetical protein
MSTLRGAAIALSASLCFLIGACLVIVGAQPKPEASLGVFPVPEIVGMTSEPRSVVLIRGTVEAAEHELLDGSVNVSALTIAAPRNSVPLMLLRDLRGETVDVVLRVVEPRTLREVKR